MQPKNLLYAAGVLVLVVAVYLTWLWQPGRQIERHQRNFLKALSDRNWQKAGEFLHASYRDRWNHDKEGALHDCRIALAQFFALEILPENATTSVSENRGSVSGLLIIRGSGTEFASLAMQRVNQLTKPFTFEWRKSGPKPWEWQLVTADQAELQFQGFDF